eukprot:TRINITY_DN14488_c0_g1_i1.p2 TRINITY_DN14488_c0_g1~~TRINITY_DN14488_c0_g1_i1.p2  ORF type:complete len:372 (+),score=58.36 TRINITY_DN14488_c0_g1_i1:107-1222(+)
MGGSDTTMKAALGRGGVSKAAAGEAQKLLLARARSDGAATAQLLVGALGDVYRTHEQTMRVLGFIAGCTEAGGGFTSAIAKQHRKGLCTLYGKGRAKEDPVFGARRRHEVHTAVYDVLRACGAEAEPPAALPSTRSTGAATSAQRQVPAASDLQRPLLDRGTGSPVSAPPAGTPSVRGYFPPSFAVRPAESAPLEPEMMQAPPRRSPLLPPVRGDAPPAMCAETEALLGDSFSDLAQRGGACAPAPDGLLSTACAPTDDILALDGPGPTDGIMALDDPSPNPGQVDLPIWRTPPPSNATPTATFMTPSLSPPQRTELEEATQSLLASGDSGGPRPAPPASASGRVCTSAEEAPSFHWQRSRMDSRGAMFTL